MKVKEVIAKLSEFDPDAPCGQLAAGMSDNTPATVVAIERRNYVNAGGQTGPQLGNVIVILTASRQTTDK